MTAFTTQATFREALDEHLAALCEPAADAFEKNQLNDPSNVAEAVVFALSQPKGCEVHELIITPSRETSWP